MTLCSSRLVDSIHSEDSWLSDWSLSLSFSFASKSDDFYAARTQPTQNWERWDVQKSHSTQSQGVAHWYWSSRWYCDDLGRRHDVWKFVDWFTVATMATTITTRATTRLNQSGASSSRDATTLFRCISLSTLGCENLIFQNQKNVGVGPSQDKYARKCTRKQ